MTCLTVRNRQPDGLMFTPEKRGIAPCIFEKCVGLARTRTNYDIFEARNKQKVGILDYFCSVFRGEPQSDIMSEFIFSDVVWGCRWLTYS